MKLLKLGKKIAIGVRQVKKLAASDNGINSVFMWSFPVKWGNIKSG